MNNFIKVIVDKHAQPVTEAYSSATKLGDFVYISAQLPIDPSTNAIVGNNIQEQTHQVIRNMTSLLEAMGLGLHHIIKTTVFLKDINTLDAFEKVYATYFQIPYPARSCVQVAQLQQNALISIECMAIDTLVYEQQMEAKQDGCSNCNGSCEGGCCEE